LDDKILSINLIAKSSSMVDKNLHDHRLLMIEHLFISFMSSVSPGKAMFHASVDSWNFGYHIKTKGMYNNIDFMLMFGSSCKRLE
jgi:hypothetical protein